MSSSFSKKCDDFHKGSINMNLFRKLYTIHSETVADLLVNLCAMLVNTTLYIWEIMSF